LVGPKRVGMRLFAKSNSKGKSSSEGRGRGETGKAQYKRWLVLNITKKKRKVQKKKIGTADQKNG